MDSMSPSFPTSHDKLLFTPGPLTTSLSVKQAMLHDAGSWHSESQRRAWPGREKTRPLLHRGRHEQLWRGSDRGGESQHRVSHLVREQMRRRRARVLLRDLPAEGFAELRRLRSKFEPRPAR